jgi:hypothetical protein
VLDNIKDLISTKANASNVDATLGGLLGPNGGVQAAQTLAKNFNIDPATIMKMIPALSPVILGALSKKRDTGSAGLSGIGSMLDADGDGSIIDDVAGFLLKDGGSTQARGKGVLGSVLGGLLRHK